MKGLGRRCRGRRRVGPRAALPGSRGAYRLPPIQNRGFRRQIDLALGVSPCVCKLEVPVMESATKDELIDRLHVAMQDLGETNHELRMKLTTFAGGRGPYPAPEEWQRFWHLGSTIDR